MFDLQENYIQSFPTLKEAARYLMKQNFAAYSNDASSATSHIRACANGKRKTAYKHIWKWDKNWYDIGLVPILYARCVGYDIYTE